MDIKSETLTGKSFAITSYSPSSGMLQVNVPDEGIVAITLAEFLKETLKTLGAKEMEKVAKDPVGYFKSRSMALSKVYTALRNNAGSGVGSPTRDRRTLRDRLGHGVHPPAGPVVPIGPAEPTYSIPSYPAGPSCGSVEDSCLSDVNIALDAIQAARMYYGMSGTNGQVFEKLCKMRDTMAAAEEILSPRKRAELLAFFAAGGTR